MRDGSLYCNRRVGVERAVNTTQNLAKSLDSHKSRRRLGRIDAGERNRWISALGGLVKIKNNRLYNTKRRLGFALYLSVKVFSMKVLIGNTIFTSLTGDGTAILRGHPSHANLHF